MSKLKSRVVTHYIEDVLDGTVPSNIHDAVYRLKSGKLLDIGSLAYKVFVILATHSIRHVDRDSLDRERESFLVNLVDHLRCSTAKPNSKRKNFLELSRFISWINENKPVTSFLDQESIKSAYFAYTATLLHRMKLKDGNKGKLKQNSAAHNQKGARTACILITGCDERDINYWAKKIATTERDTFTPTLTHAPKSDEDRLATYAAHCEFVDQTWRFLVKKESTEVVLQGNLIATSDNLYSGREEVLYNRVIISALMSFIGASGANLSVATSAELADFSRIESLKGTRLAGVKARARDKIVYPEFSKKYEPVWKKWLDIRNYWLTTNNLKSNWAFPYKGAGELRSVPSSLTEISKPTGQLFTKTLKLRWITPRDWRGFKSTLIGRVTDQDIYIAAEMQGHTFKTALRSYQNRDLSDAATEISFALDRVYESAVIRSRNQEHIEVIIIDDYDPLKSTATGGCLSEDALKPQKAAGFTEYAPEPNCSVKETCIFCDKYAAHADATDIRKLLSLKVLINDLGKSMPHQEWANRWPVYLDRVEEILEQMKLERPESKELIQQLAEDVEYGELDEFWLDWYETLNKLGVISA